VAEAVADSVSEAVADSVSELVTNTVVHRIAEFEELLLSDRVMKVGSPSVLAHSAVDDFETVE